MDDLTTLLHEAVEHVEPTDRLAELRARTRRPSRARWYAVGGTVLATAAVVTGIAIATRPSNDPGPGPSHDSTPTATDSATPGLSAYGVYYLGDTPQGPRLYREFTQAPGPGVAPVAVQLLSNTPDDPEYRTLWPDGAFSTAQIKGGHIEVVLADDSLHDRPADMSATEAELSVQQVVYTMQAAAHGRLPVQFVLNGNPIDQVLGVPTSEPLANAPQTEVLALVNISDPAEGRVVDGSFSANGVAMSFEGVVPWRLEDSDGNVVKQGAAQGTMEDHLTPWETGPIDVSDLAPGSYTFVASTDDPSGGEGPGPTTDTRTITIR
jgi:hypothetical protein